MNAIAPERVPFRLAGLLPANSDRLAYDIGLIDRSASFEVVRRGALIDDRARELADDPEFSKRIRE